MKDDAAIEAAYDRMVEIEDLHEIVFVVDTSRNPPRPGVTTCVKCGPIDDKTHVVCEVVEQAQDEYGRLYDAWLHAGRGRLIPVEPRPDDQCNCYRSMTTGKFENGHEYPCQGGEH